jgi:hypothetical protein
MAQVMEANPRQPGAFKRLMEVVNYLGSLERGARLIGENQIVLDPFRSGPQLLGELSLGVLVKASDDAWWDHQRTPTAICFRFNER